MRGVNVGLFGPASKVDTSILDVLHPSQRERPPAKAIAKRQRPLLELLDNGDELQFAYLSQTPTTELIGLSNRLLIGVGWANKYFVGGVRSFPYHAIAEVDTSVTPQAKFLMTITSGDALPFKPYASRTDAPASRDKYWEGTIMAGFSDQAAYEVFLATLQNLGGQEWNA